MTSISLSQILPNENNWPFLGRSAELQKCLGFLKPDNELAESRLLRIVGESGTGKSFFAKELLRKFTQQTPDALALYVDINECEFESVEFEKQLARLASFPAQPTRRDPQHVPVNSEVTIYKKPLARWLRALRYSAAATKEAVKALPIVGKALSPFLPKEIPLSKKRQLIEGGNFWEYLVTTAERTPVLVVIDNYQFLPHPITIEIDSKLALSETGFRFIVVERIHEGKSGAWELRCFGNNRLEIPMLPLTLGETQKLVEAILSAQTEKLPAINEAIYRKSNGNPKQIWLQLRSFILNENLATPNIYEEQRRLLRHIESREEGNQGAYEEMIQSLPELDQLALQLITLLMGGLKVDDIVSILCSVVNPYSESEIRKTLTDLAIIGLLIINGSENDRIRVEHELVAHAVRRHTSEERALELKEAAVAAISSRLAETANDAEYERLVDRLIGLVSSTEIRNSHELLAHLIALIDRQSLKANYRYLIWLFGTSTCSQVLDILPSYCSEIFLNAFQKTSQFDRGLAGVQMIKGAATLRSEKLALYESKFLVQKFDYDEALNLLERAGHGSERDLVFHNVLLNLCRDEEARDIVESILLSFSDLNEFQCVILRNSAHLYEPAVAIEIINRALQGFRNLGLEFGEATTLNNLGIVYLFVGDYDKAASHFEESVQKLVKLDSNEAYQPLVNLAVVKALQGNFAGAEELFTQSQGSMPLSLRMDLLMLEFNRLVLGLMSGRVGVKEAYPALVQLHRNSLRIKDLRFRAIVNWFLAQLGDETRLRVSSDPSDMMVQSMMNSSLAGIEVFFDFQPFGKCISTGVFVLSPHWRY